MTDVFSTTKRSSIMRAIRARDTKPELIVRRLIHRLGYRYRLHQRSLPGCPDLVFGGRMKVIFVNGCFWHRHTCRKGRSTPATRRSFWRKKLEGNHRRDRANNRALNRRGWRVFTVWECQVGNLHRLGKRVRQFLGD